MKFPHVGFEFGTSKFNLEKFWLQTWYKPNHEFSEKQVYSDSDRKDW